MSKYTSVPMAPDSSTLAWKIPWMEEPGRLQSMGSLRVGHDWATSLSLFTFMHWRRKWQLQCSCLENPRDGGAWWAAVYGSHRVGHDWSDLAAAAANFPNTIYWKDCLPLVYSWLLCCKLIDHKCVILFLGSLYSVPLNYGFVFMLIWYCCNYHSLVIDFEIRGHDEFSFVLFSQDCFSYLGSLWFPTHFRICFWFYFCEKCYWNFDRNCTEYVDFFR